MRHNILARTLLRTLGISIGLAGWLQVTIAVAQQGRIEREFDKGPARPESDKSEPKRTPLPPPQRGPDGKSTRPKAAEAVEPKPIPKSMRRPGGTSVPEAASQRATLLTELYAHLATAPDEDVAKRTTNAIEHVWSTSGSDTVTLLMERATRAARDKKKDLAIRLLDQAAQLAPDYPEVFNRRAMVHFAHNNVDQALGDLRRVLALDGNHYKALEGLAQIFKETERKKAALAVFRRLYEVHPHMQGVKSAMDELAREIEGNPS